MAQDGCVRIEWVAKAGRTSFFNPTRTPGNHLRSAQAAYACTAGTTADRSELHWPALGHGERRSGTGYACRWASSRPLHLGRTDTDGGANQHRPGVSSGLQSARPHYSQIPQNRPRLSRKTKMTQRWTRRRTKFRARGRAPEVVGPNLDLIPACIEPGDPRPDEQTRRQWHAPWHAGTLA